MQRLLVDVRLTGMSATYISLLTMKERTFKDCWNASDSTGEYLDLGLRRDVDGQRGLEHDAVGRHTTARVGEPGNS